MNSSQSNPNDAFWLARYAHNTLTPIIQALPGQDDKRYAYLYLAITGHQRFPGLDIWIHQEGHGGGVVDYATITVTKETVDLMAARLPAKWQELLTAVTA